MPISISTIWIPHCSNLKKNTKEIHSPKVASLVVIPGNIDPLRSETHLIQSCLPMPEPSAHVRLFFIFPGASRIAHRAGPSVAFHVLELVARNLSQRIDHYRHVGLENTAILVVPLGGCLPGSGTMERKERLSTSPRREPLSDGAAERKERLSSSPRRETLSEGATERARERWSGATEETELR
ncbi:hypothetical protein VTN31DRAFT_50 [Thermomyces dupontii]|uniref:uncharacterized protein n=1 Tax=Talaromyces thermophilus TaxID=28565 RepID=UPI0037440DFC